jgi:hypothetical protein
VPSSRTVNPLHFEDLEPHRFEDLVRQLAYDFRPWYALEAVGRTGSDQGIDIRGIERLGAEPSESLESDDAEAEPVQELEQRTWIIQCKREKTLPPGKLKTVIDESLRSFESPPYGFIIAAATDFSLKAREVFRAEMRTRGIQEFALWGKAELEDRLFEPRHDHLLFAYFGISIQARKRSARAVSSSRLTTKRRLIKVLGSLHSPNHEEVLLRDAESEEYPVPNDPEKFKANPLWRYFRFAGYLRVDQLGFVVREYFAWIKPEEGKWDALKDYDQGYLHHPQLYYGPQRHHAGEDDQEEQQRRFWLTKIPEQERAHLRTVGFVHYDRIVAIDDVGDRFHESPHLLLACSRPDELFDDLVDVVEQGYGYEHRLWHLCDIERASLFPEPLPAISSEEFSAALEKRIRS